MNTLDKIAKLESEVSLLKQMIATVPADSQMLSSVNQGLSNLAQNQKQNVERTNQIFTMIGEKQDLVVQRIMAIEQTIASLGKMLTATLSELADNHELNYNNVSARVRKYDESQEQERVRQLVQFGSIQAVEEVSDKSLIVVSQKFNAKETGEETTVAEYRVYEVNSPLNSKEEVSKYVGKRSGDSVTVELEDGTLTTTILEVYSQTEVDIKQNVEDSVS